MKIFQNTNLAVAVLATGLALGGAASAQELDAARRASLLEFYPCASGLTDPQLDYLGDWANATKTDPCLLDAAEFTANFGGDMVAEAGAGDPMAHVQAYFAEAGPHQLFLYQRLTMAHDTADGVWGPQTAARFAASLDTYHAIGGMDAEWGVRSAADVPRFLSWLLAAEYASAVGGEFPD